MTTVVNVWEIQYIGMEIDTWSGVVIDESHHTYTIQPPLATVPRTVPRTDCTIFYQDGKILKPHLHKPLLKANGKVTDARITNAPVVEAMKSVERPYMYGRYAMAYVPILDCYVDVTLDERKTWYAWSFGYVKGGTALESGNVSYRRFFAGRGNSMSNQDVVERCVSEGFIPFYISYKRNNPFELLRECGHVRTRYPW